MANIGVISNTLLCGYHSWETTQKSNMFTTYVI